MATFNKNKTNFHKTIDKIKICGKINLLKIKLKFYVRIKIKLFRINNILNRK